jgi:hypothetical protein
VTATPDIRQGRGADDAVTATPDIRQGRGTDDAVTATADIRQGRGADDAVTATPDIRQGRGADDAVTATPDIRQGRGADDAVTATPDIRQGRGTDDAVTATADIRQGRGADDAVAASMNVSQGQRADEVAVIGAEDRGIVDTVINFVTSALGFGDSTPTASLDDLQGQGADDAAVNADGTPHIRQSRGADPLVPTASGSAVSTVAALSPNAENTTQLRTRDIHVVFGASQQASQTPGLAPKAIYRTNGERHNLDVIVAGYVWHEGIGTADLENGEIIGNLPNKQRLRFAVYANAQQAQAAASLWAAQAPEATRADSALIAAETGIITWDAETGRPDDDGSDGMGGINGLFLTSERMPEFNDAYLRGKVIQIYGPLVTALDYAGNPISCSRQVYWTSSPLP